METADRPAPRQRVAGSAGATGSALTALVESARAGDEQAFRELHARCAPAVHGVLISMVQPQDAADLVQEVFFQAWRSLGALRDPERCGAWLIQIARRRARRHRGRRTAPAVELSEDIPQPAQSRDRSAEILTCLRRLPEAYRETLAMRLGEGLDGPRIAAVTGRSPGAVRVNLSRGMQLLREELRRQGWNR